MLISFMILTVIFEYFNKMIIIFICDFYNDSHGDLYYDFYGDFLLWLSWMISKKISMVISWQLW